jgi:hypothetical protein
LGSVNSRGSLWSGLRSAGLSVVLLLLSGILLQPLSAAETVNMAERSLRKIVERQKEVFAEAVKQGENLDEGSFRQHVQSISHDYELLLRHNPEFAAGYAGC